MPNLIQGNIIPGQTTTDICNSQYILNWLATGGNQADSDLSGNNNVTSVFDPDTSFNIQDKNISFFFTDPNNNNISTRDAQYIINWKKAGETTTNNINRTLGGDTSKKYSVHEYSYPESRDFITLVTYEDLIFGSSDLSNICINRLYLKQKNSSTQNFTDASALPLDPYILANRIPYLKLNKDSGYMLKRYDSVQDGSSTIQIYKSGYDSNNNLRENTVLTISSENLPYSNINRNTNYMYPPTKELIDSPFITPGQPPSNYIKVDFIASLDIFNVNNNSFNDLSNILIKTPWWTGSDNSGLAHTYAMYYKKPWGVYPYSINGNTVKCIQYGNGWSGDYWEGAWEFNVSMTQSHHAEWPIWWVYAKTNIDIYTHLGLGTTQPFNNKVNYTTTYTNVNNQQIEIPNWGVQSVDISSNRLANRLTQVDTLNTTTSNMLNINKLGENNTIDFNKTSWLLANESVNSTQGHFIGQFVFSKDATGSMIHQYFYSTDNTENLYTENSPYTVYFNISGGRLEFPGEYPGTIVNTLDLTNTLSSSADKTNPWTNDGNGYLAKIVANIYKQPGLKFCYTYDSFDIINIITLHYIEWNNFKITDSSMASDQFPNARWAQFPSTENPQFTADQANMVTHAINTFLVESPDASGSIYIYTQNTNNGDWYKYYLTDPGSDSYPLQLYLQNINTIILGRENVIWKLDIESSTEPVVTFIDGILISNAFKNYTNLEHIIFNNNSTNLSNIGSGFVNGLTKLKHITIPSYILNIHHEAFINCPGLRTITFLGEKGEFFNNLDFSGCNNLSNIFYINGKPGWFSENIFGGIILTPPKFNLISI